MQFVDPHTGTPYEWEFVNGRKVIPVETAGLLTFGDPVTMLKECVSGTGIAQVIAWCADDLLKKGELIDLFPEWHGELFPLFAFHPSRKHPPAKFPAFMDFCVEVVGKL